MLHLIAFSCCIYTLSCCNTCPRYKICNILYRPESSESDAVVAKHAMLQHQGRVMVGLDDDSCRQRIHVRRNNLVGDAMRALRKSSFDPAKLLNVLFVGEPSVDEGGPRREFFQLVIKEVFMMSGLFHGWPQNVVLAHNVEALADNRYLLVGKLIAMCLVQGGQPPVCFSAAVADYLVYGEITSQPCIDDIYDPEIQGKIRNVKYSDIHGVSMHIYINLLDPEHNIYCRVPRVHSGPV